MKITVDSRILLDATKEIAGIITSNPVMEVLGCLLFNVHDGTVDLTATDLESTITVSLGKSATVEGSGKFCAPKDVFVNFLAKASGQVVLTINGLQMQMELGKGHYEIGLLNPDDYPVTPSISASSTCFDLDIPAFSAAADATIPFCSSDTLRPAMTGVCFDIDGTGKVTMVSTDAHQLARYPINALAEAKPHNSVVVPKKFMSLLRKVVARSSGSVSFFIAETMLFAKTDEMTAACRLIDAVYPDYKAVIPSDNPYRLTIDRAMLASALTRVSLFANKTTMQVVMSIAGQSLELSGCDLDFNYDAKETVPCGYHGADMSIVFNAGLLIGLLTTYDCETVEFHLSKPTRAAIITEPNAPKDGRMCLIMPLMIGV